MGGGGSSTPTPTPTPTPSRMATDKIFMVFMCLIFCGIIAIIAAKVSRSVSKYVIAIIAAKVSRPVSTEVSNRGDTA